MTIKEIIQKLHITMTDACLQESHFEYCLILNEGIIDAIDALKALDKQEPVAWVCYGSSDSEMHDIDFEQEVVDALTVGTILYTTPPQSTWVGMTDIEIDELWMSHHDDFGNPLSETGYERAIEAKLKEKNT